MMSGFTGMIGRMVNSVTTKGRVLAMLAVGMASGGYGFIRRRQRGKSGDRGNRGTRGPA